MIWNWCSGCFELIDFFILFLLLLNVVMVLMVLGCFGFVISDINIVDGLWNV